MAFQHLRHHGTTQLVVEGHTTTLNPQAGPCTRAVLSIHTAVVQVTEHCLQHLENIHIATLPPRMTSCWAVVKSTYNKHNHSFKRHYFVLNNIYISICFSLYGGN